MYAPLELRPLVADPLGFFLMAGEHLLHVARRRVQPGRDRLRPRQPGVEAGNRRAAVPGGTALHGRHQTSHRLRVPERPGAVEDALVAGSLHPGQLLRLDPLALLLHEPLMRCAALVGLFAPSGADGNQPEEDVVEHVLQPGAAPVAPTFPEVGAVVDVAVRVDTELAARRVVPGRDLLPRVRLDARQLGRSGDMGCAVLLLGDGDRHGLALYRRARRRDRMSQSFERLAQRVKDSQRPATAATAHVHGQGSPHYGVWRFP